MQKSILLTVLACCCLFVVQGQDPKSEKFGKVDPEWVKMETYETNKDAEAVVIMEIGEASQFYSGGFQIVHSRHYRIKVLSEAGLDYADIEIPFYDYRGIDRISELRAITHNYENGELVSYKLDKKTVFEEDINGYYSRKKFSMPNVKKGSVIEVKYAVTSHSASTLEPWYFQRRIPVLYSKYSKRVIDGFDYRTTALGEIQPLDKKRNFGQHSRNYPQC